MRCALAPHRGALPRLAALALLALGAGDQRDPLLVLIHTDPALLEDLHVTVDEVIAKLERDLQAEFGSGSGRGLSVRVERTSLDFKAVLEARVERIEDEHGIPEAIDRVSALRSELLSKGLPSSPEWAAAQRELDRAAAAVRAEIESCGNLAGLARGTVGIQLDAGRHYGGWSFPGERWGLVYVGLVDQVFPAPDVLDPETNGAEEVAAIDFRDPHFDPFREGYSERTRRRYIRQYIANGAQERLGHVFDLPSNRSGPSDAMCAAVRLQRAEHFRRDAEPVRYEDSDRERLVRRIQEEVEATR